MAPLSSYKRLSQLVDDAQAAATGGHRTVPERLLQHRDLLLAVKELMDHGAKLDERLQLLWNSLKLYPAYDHGNQGEPARYRWGIRNAEQFHTAIQSLKDFCNPTA